MIFAARLLFGLRSLLKRVPWQVWAIVALVASVWLYGRHMEAQGYAKAEAVWQAKAAKLEAERKAALDSEEAALRDLAKRTDRNVYQEREANRSRMEQFIARGGVRGQACPSYRDPAGGSAGSGPSVREAPVVDAAEQVQVVGVTAQDVRICSDNTLKAEAMRDFILGLEDK